MMKKVFRFGSFALLAVFVMVLAVALWAIPALADTAEDVVRFTNEERSDNGLASLKMDQALMKAAAARARECSAKYSHDRPNGSKCFTILKEYGVSYTAAAENIYRDNGNRSAASAVDGWMDSPGHRQNILTPDFTHIGVGVYTKDGWNYAVQLFIEK